MLSGGKANLKYSYVSHTCQLSLSLSARDFLFHITRISENVTTTSQNCRRCSDDFRRLLKTDMLARSCKELALKKCNFAPFAGLFLIIVQIKLNFSL